MPTLSCKNASSFFRSESICSFGLWSRLWLGGTQIQLSIQLHLQLCSFPIILHALLNHTLFTKLFYTAFTLKINTLMQDFLMQVDMSLLGIWAFSHCQQSQVLSSCLEVHSFFVFPLIFVIPSHMSITLQSCNFHRNFTILSFFLLQ